MALKLSPVMFQSQKLPFIASYPPSNLRSPRVYMASTLRSSTKVIDKGEVIISRSPSVLLGRYMFRSPLDPTAENKVFKSLEIWAEENILPVERVWQPQISLPEPESEDFWNLLENSEASKKRSR
ncbi:stearoyl-acyl-carrier-protein desaturase [Cinnamomum micranthum f. kanehirae]|uniref:Stearoyl-acyl-carrier-protein desaturase n=1 Tax=Cinnamomum micranthum f. kanehirae TaxID=337451 RepID=A0A3S3M8K9_9MAGN|nr:stearoyl-acyl-carrier-protein desaturase [Cinnamomum micranthum f. kanehirae]